MTVAYWNLKISAGDKNLEKYGDLAGGLGHCSFGRVTGLKGIE